MRLCRFGRKSTMIFGAVGSAALCLVQSLSVNFSMFLTLELLSSLVSSGVYMITFVLGKLKKNKRDTSNKIRFF